MYSYSFFRLLPFRFLLYYTPDSCIFQYKLRLYYKILLQERKKGKIKYTEKREGEKKEKMYRIRDLREDRDLTQRELAKILKTTQQQYSKIETGKSDITGEKLKLLAEFYNVSADYLLGLTNRPRPLR